MKICVFGAGAVGGTLAARLAHAGNDVSVVVRGAALAVIRASGLTMRAGEEVIHAKVRASDRPQDLGVQDVVISTLKAGSLPALATGIAPLLAADTAVVFAQNGIPWWYALDTVPSSRPMPDLSALDPGAALAAAVPRRSIVAGIVYSANTALAPGVIENNSPQQNRILLANLDDSADERLQALRRALAAAGIKSGDVPNVRQEIWQKLVSNIVTGATILVGEPTNTMLAEPRMRQVAERLVDEVAAIAAAHGVNVAKLMPNVPAGKKASILQDYELGRPMEVESQYLAPLAFARAAGIAAPTLETVAATIAHLAAARGLFSPART